MPLPKYSTSHLLQNCWVPVPSLSPYVEVLLDGPQAAAAPQNWSKCRFPSPHLAQLKQELQGVAQHGVQLTGFYLPALLSIEFSRPGYWSG